METLVNVLFLIQYGKIGGGINKTLTSQLSMMDRTRFNIYVIAAEDGPIVDVLKPLVDNITVISVPKSVLYKKRDKISNNLLWAPIDFLKLLPFFVKSYLFIRRTKIDVMHCNNLKTNFLGVVLSKISRVPVICHIRSATSLGIMGKVYEWGATSIISVSYGAQALSFGGTRETKKHKVIYNGRDLTEFGPKFSDEKIRQELGICKNELVVAIIGGLIRWKGHMTFLEAASKIVDKVPNTKFLIVGNADYEDPHYQEELYNLVESLGIGDKVLFTGYRGDIHSIYAVIDVLVSASWYEPLGGVIIEAMASCKPVVGTKAAGTPEIIEDGKTGLLVPPKHPEKMADAVVTILQNERLRTEMGRAGRVRAENMFTIERYVEDMQSEYTMVVGRDD